MKSGILLSIIICSQPSVLAQLSKQTSVAQQAHVFIYRYKLHGGSALSPSVYCDEVQLARMVDGRYFVVALAAGQHVFRSDDKQSGLKLDLQAGQRHYIRVELASGFPKARGHLVLMPREQGQYEIGMLRPLDSTKIKDHSMVVTADDANPAREAEVSAESLPLTNADITTLKAAGVSDELIIAKIRVSQARFALDTSDLVRLKEKAISDSVIAAMLQAQTK